MRTSTILMVCLGVAVSAVPATAESISQKTASTTGIVDVALTPEGALAGQFLDGEGRGIDGAFAVLSRGEQIIAETTTDASGSYHITGLRPGVYQLTVGNRTQTVRAWPSTAAPPSARPLLTTIRSDRVVRGQFGIIGGAMSSTVGVVGGVAGAAAGGYSVMESMDAKDDAEAAMAEAAELREMMHHLMSP